MTIGNLAQHVSKIRQFWMVKHDEPAIRALYRKFQRFASELNYSAQVKRIGTELLVLDQRLQAPPSLDGMQLAA
jgi:DNA adenine methylase